MTPRRASPSYEALSPNVRAFAPAPAYVPPASPAGGGAPKPATPGSGGVARVLAANGQPRKVPAAMLGQMGSSKMASLLEG